MGSHSASWASCARWAIALAVLVLLAHEVTAEVNISDLLEGTGAQGLDTCSQPAASGFCRAWFPRLYFNPATGGCDFFVWGGCGGNDNRFLDEADCCLECSPDPESCLNVTDASATEIAPLFPMPGVGR